LIAALVLPRITKFVHGQFTIAVAVKLSEERWHVTSAAVAWGGARRTGDFKQS